MINTTRFVVYWTFRNDHTWSKCFDTSELRELFIHTVGLQSHPDIVKIVTCQGPGTEKTLKDKEAYHD